ncbi:hypothetical protein [Ornithinibacillus scapharcae]|uniref:hypothetical protein n=1 Tax=Ornithinibacillus scapharcae TaxID=1147159 RepID=UPI000225AAC1|nr:hypothetical protein [Ornithinibacillus scapharcae]
MIRKLFVLLLLLFIYILPLLNPNHVQACDCAVPETANEALEKASAVFMGEVMRIREEKIIGEPHDVALISVSEIWKGLENSQVEVYTDWSSCQFSFEVGREYLLYPYENNGRLHVIDCGRSAKVNEAQDDLLELGQGEEPRIIVHLEKELEDNQVYLMMILVVLIFAILVIIISILRYNRKRN